MHSSPRSRRKTRHTAHDVAHTYRSGDAFFAFDADLTVVAWNDAAEQLTGIKADDAIGRPCWDVLRGITERGDLICHPGCSVARLAKEGWPRSCSRMLISTPNGRKLVSVSTISVHRKDEDPVVLNLLRNGFAIEATKKATQKLTSRQVEVLQCLTAGKQVRAIAEQLGISETTTRNHVAAILRRLGCHSQLEAVAEARRLELV
jgi:DNA-binding CsgD family transcriptional regulator